MQQYIFKYFAIAATAAASLIDPSLTDTQNEIGLPPLSLNTIATQGNYHSLIARGK